MTMRIVLSLLASSIVLGAVGAHAAESRQADSPARIVPLGPPAWIGVTMDQGGDTGVRIEHVVRGGPADRAGVRVGDRIVAIDGARVTRPAQVAGAVTSRKAGETLTLSIERMGNGIDATVKLASRPTGDEILKMDLVGAPAPEWINVHALTGAPQSLASLRGRVVILDFWASWCGPCRMLAPKLSSLKNRFGAQGLSVVGVTTDDAERAAVFGQQHRMTYPSVVDKDGDTNRAYGVVGLPTMIVIDKKGVVREVFVGYDPSGDARMEQTVKSLLAESGPPKTKAPPPSVPRPSGR